MESIILFCAFVMWSIGLIAIGLFFGARIGARQTLNCFDKAILKEAIKPNATKPWYAE